MCIFNTHSNLLGLFFLDSALPDLDNFARLGFGFLSGCVGAVITMPMDVIKTVAMRQKSATEAKSPRQILATILRERGVSTVAHACVRRPALPF